MARQEEIFAQTITDMKRAMLRKADDSEGDDFIEKPTNRGNKRKRGAAFVQEGRLDQANPLKRYKRTINYNGYMRDIISKNSFRVDPDGDVIDEEDVDSTIELSDLEEDPYKDVRIEDLLMPLTSTGSLKDHPTLSLPYTSKALDEIIHSAQEMVQREQNNLFRLKQLASGLRGDASWMPVGAFESENDGALIAEATTHPSAPASVDTVDFAEPAIIQEEQVTAADRLNGAVVDGQSSLGSNELPSAAEQGGEAQATSEKAYVEDQSDEIVKPALGKRPKDEDAHAELENATSEAYQAINRELPSSNGPDNGQQAPTSTELNGATPGQGHYDNQQDSVPNAESKPFDPDETMEDENGPQAPTTADGASIGEQADGEGGDGDGEEDTDSQPQHRMTTRAKAAEAAFSPSLSAEEDLEQPPHPFFLLPPSTFPSRDLGLPPAEAAETRRLMTAYIQRQEDAVANTWLLLKGLLRARQYRDDVMEWCTAEAHVGEMSDGEDWYDKEYWGLEGDLKKGEDVVEDEEQAMGVGGRKKTRRARAGG